LSFVLDQLPCGTWSFGSTLYLVGFSDVFWFENVPSLGLSART
jgi:hypothetical protein